MRSFLQIIYSFMISVFMFLSRTMQDYVVPSINFVNALKFLLVDKEFLKNDKFDFKRFLIDKFSIASHYIDKILELFIKCIKILLPAEIDGNTFEICLRQFLAYLQTLSDRQKALLYFKLASLMVFYWINEAPNKTSIKEHESDFLVQLAYSKLKLETKLPEKTKTDSDTVKNHSMVIEPEPAKKNSKKSK